MLIILFAAIIIFLSAKSRFNRAHMEGSSANYGGRCGGGSSPLGLLGRSRRRPRRGRDGLAALAFPSPGASGEGGGKGSDRGGEGGGLKHNNLLLLIPQLSPNHLHETRI